MARTEARLGVVILMLPDWVIILAAIELFGFLIFGLSIATAIPENEIAPEERQNQTAS
jgi:hypothetical protein